MRRISRLMGTAQGSRCGSEAGIFGYTFDLPLNADCRRTSHNWQS